MSYKHIPVMLSEVVHYLDCKPGKIYADCTLGGSGHASAILEKIIPDGILIGIDQDIDAIKNAKRKLKPYELKIHLFHDNFINLPKILSQLNITAVDGILLDLGISFHHLESSGRGFSFRKDEPLDMRMNIESDTTAEELVNTMDEKSLAEIFYKYGEERYSRKIAKKIVNARKKKKIKSSRQLSEIVCGAVSGKASFRRRIHPATRVFMAVRIAVNKELDILNSFMETAVDLLNPEGRFCILSFHSLEDRIVKKKIKRLEGKCICPPALPRCVCNKTRVIRSLTRKVLRPTEEEIAANPMARSAKLRAIEKL
ncbi:MAG: 16S rRNA (cytosine(1402)-N(4))-methyltransferase RsmH [Desulfobacteraceae bacterium]|nr:16S rRNA (cytosine(1402)-N(4))-methyltransferase RsmH [Desulfobacteraceae bacterium]MBC2719319.1 16S rRNA (cytosine(1402)-N(4))-methyltransferase RsmH [Desulfobacteraceae bacterium]